MPEVTVKGAVDYTTIDGTMNLYEAYSGYYLIDLLTDQRAPIGVPEMGVRDYNAEEGYRQVADETPEYRAALVHDVEKNTEQYREIYFGYRRGWIDKLPTKDYLFQLAQRIGQDMGEDALRTPGAGSRAFEIGRQNVARYVQLMAQDLGVSNHRALLILFLDAINLAVVRGYDIDSLYTKDES